MQRLVAVDGRGSELRFDPEALADAACADSVAPAADLPPGRGSLAAELAASPVAQRVAHLGAAAGLDFVHHELRVEPRYPLDLGPELTVSDAGQTDPVWAGGHLEQPKYFSGFLESPRCRYVPGHRLEWRTHEVAHRLAGFFWRADMSRFELYLGARLSELFPVVHWYGLDDVGRPRCEPHREHAATRIHCGACEAAALARLEGSAAQPSPTRARSSARFALEHWRRECAAIEREIETGELHASPWGHLDGSSDAIGYLRGHWNRTTAWSFGAWVERFGGRGSVIEHRSDVREQLEHISRLMADALGGAPADDPETRQRRRARRRLADLGYRIAVALEDPGLDDLSETALMEALDRAAELDASLARGEGVDVDLQSEVEGTLRFAARQNDGAVSLFALGEAEPGHPAGLEQLAAGLVSSLPATFSDVAEDSEVEMDRLAASHAVATSDAFWSRGGLPARAAVADLGYFDDAARLEAWLLAPPRADLEAERFGALPDEPEQLMGGRVRPNSTLRTVVASPAAASRVLDLPLAGPAELLAIVFEGEPRVLESNAGYRAALQAVAAGDLSRLEEDDSLAILLDAGFVVWFPPVRRASEPTA